MSEDIARLYLALQAQYTDRAEELRKQAAQEERKQNYDATIVGFSKQTGRPLVEVQGGVVDAVALSDGFKVGEVVSYFLPRGASVGFVDKRSPG
ncbi:MAG TPA: hypothetical protein V6D19_00220 [Stenomitos sp.]